MRITAAVLLLALLGHAQDFERKRDVIYGRKHGLAMTMDVFSPKKDANGAAVLSVVSGGWFSSTRSIRPGFYGEYLKRGYTVFAVVHGSTPRFTIVEAANDIHRAVRFIRFKAKEYKIDPERIGITGGSAGGHLSLLIATAGTAGNPKAPDPVLRQSSRVSAVAAFFPPTDFLNWQAKGVNVLETQLMNMFKAPFDFKVFDKKTRAYVPVTDKAELKKLLVKISPVYHASADDPPTLLIHGDRDLLVPLQQSHLMKAALEKAKVKTKLVVKEGAGHGWRGMGKDLVTCADWFDTHLAKRAPATK